MDIKINTDAFKKYVGFTEKKSAKYGRPEGSLTLEAAMVVPIVLIMLTTVMGWSIFLGNLAETKNSLNNKAREAARIINVVSDKEDEDITFAEKMSYDSMFKLFPLKGDVYLVAKASPFVGLSYSDETTTEESEDDAEVYVTETGNVYHINAICSYLKLSIRKTNSAEVDTLRNSDGSRYKSCEKCGSLATNGELYITSDGDRFHTTLRCSGLKRSIRIMSKKEAEQMGMSVCSRCGK